MKDIIRIDNNSFNINLQVDKLINYILDWNNNRDLILYSYNGIQYKEHLRLIYPYSKIESISFKLIEHDNEFINYINNNDLSNVNILLACQYIENISNDYIRVKEDNLYNLFGINKKVIIFEYHLKQFSSNVFLLDYLREHEKILENKKLWVN